MRLPERYERFGKEPIGKDKNGNDVYLKDIWASLDEVKEIMQTAFDPENFKKLYGDFAGKNPLWNDIPTTAGQVYEWDENSTYIQDPPYFEGFTMEAENFQISKMRVRSRYSEIR